MNTLATLEHALAAHVLHADSAIESEIIGTARVPISVRLGIYRDAYVLRIIEALDTDYAGLHALSGDDAWNTLTRDYIAAHPSTHFSLRMFGRHLAAFLRETPPWNGHAAFADMAEFEWAIAHAFDAADATLLTIEQVSRIAPDDWPDMRFTFHPSMVRLDLHGNVPAFWNAVKAGDAPPAPTHSDTPAAWLVWRKGLNSYFRSLATEEAFALDALQGGRSFGDICADLGEWMAPEETPAFAASLLKRWIEDEIISGVQA